MRCIQTLRTDQYRGRIVEATLALYVGDTESLQSFFYTLAQVPGGALDTITSPRQSVPFRSSTSCAILTINRPSFDYARLADKRCRNGTDAYRRCRRKPG